MSTKFIVAGVIFAAFSACSQGVRSVYQSVPAPLDSALLANRERQWAKVRVEGAYGPFEMRVPVVSIRPVAGAGTMLVVDSIALQHVERRLTSRIANVARAEAAAVHNDTLPFVMPATHRAPELQPGLLGSIPFEPNAAVMAGEARARIAAIAQMATQLPGALEFVAVVDGNGPAAMDAGLIRARQAYLATVAAEPSLGTRDVRLTVQTRASLPGAPRRLPSVEIFATAAR